MIRFFKRPPDFVIGEMRCKNCGMEFTPKPRGYNARYCSDNCKRRSQRKRLKLFNPEQLQSARSRSYQATKNNPDRLNKHRISGNNYRSDVRAWLAEYKIEMGCVDCGYKKHYSALQLDHEGIKSVEISDARSSISRLKKEIEDGNCKVRCANCHSIKTWERKQSSLREGGNAVGKGCDE